MNAFMLSVEDVKEIYNIVGRMDAQHIDPNEMTVMSMLNVET